jgi:hypothetical protein
VIYAALIAATFDLDHDNDHRAQISHTRAAQEAIASGVGGIAAWSNQDLGPLSSDLCPLTSDYLVTGHMSLVTS